MKKFSWDLCYACNYRCSYCRAIFQHDHSQPEYNIEKWAQAWRRIYNKYGSAKISLSGGEPSVFPKFSEAIEMLLEYHLVKICTNLSWDVDKLISEQNIGKLMIYPTFHPLNADFEIFIHKVITARRHLESEVRYLLYPGKLDNFFAMRERLLPHDIDLLPIPVIDFDTDSAMNTPEELAAIDRLFGKSEEKKKELSFISLQKSPKQRLCRAGKDFASIQPDGHVRRCPHINEKSGSLGSFFNPDFTMNDKSLPCSHDQCFVPGYQEEETP